MIDPSLRLRPSSAPEPESRHLDFEMMEPRILMSAVAVESGADRDVEHHDAPIVVQSAAIAAETPAAKQEEHDAENEILAGLNHHAADLEARGGVELVFISAGVHDQTYLTQHLDPAYEVHVIEGGSDGVGQIAKALAGRSGIDAIHIISHGEAGRLQLGNTILDASSMGGDQAELLRQIGNSLSSEGDILIYGCDFSQGEDGEAALKLLSDLTGADVAASNNKTGHHELGGDWLLESAAGHIEAASIALHGWQGVLAAPSVSVPGSGNSTLEDTPFVFNGANSFTVGSDTYLDLTVTLSVGQGTLSLAGTTGLTFLEGTQNGSSLVKVQGSITDLNAALNGLIFTPAPDVHGSATITATAMDEDTATTSSSVTLSIISQNDAPVLVVNPVNAGATGTPSETVSHTFTLSNFQAVDPDNSNNQLTYIIESLPVNGVLRLNGFPVVAGSIFTQSALASGALVYVHNGGENHSDSFVLTVNDGAGGTDANVTIPITITPVNDSMSVSTQAVVYEGGSTSDGAVGPGKPVPVLSLSIGDAESDAKTVTITSLPGGGTLYYNGTPLTQTMINAGFTFPAANFSLLRYTHDGVDDLGTRPSNRSFNIRVVDQGGGAGAGAIQTVNHTVNINVVGVNDELQLVTLRTTTPTIASGNSYVLGLSDIEVNDPDGPNAQITYTLVSSPLHGQLYIGGQRAGAGASFTQGQLAAGQVVFTNGGVNAIDRLYLKATDSEVSILTDELGTVRTGDHTTAARILELPFQLTAGTGGSGGTLIRINEGEALAVPGAVAGDVVQLVTAPARGSVLVNGSPLAVGSPHVVQAGDTIVYQHDGAHVDADGFTWLVNGNTRPVTVEVLLSNDAPILTIVAPVTGGYEGFTRAITTDNLVVTDEETTNPAHLVYTVTGSPAQGTLLKNGVAIPPFGTFTHQDVIDGLISYQHNGSERFLDSVTLRVSDGAATDTGVLSIITTPVNDRPSVTANFMELLEGQMKAFTAAQLGVSDVDGSGSDLPLTPDGPLQIRIDGLPARGTLLYNDPVLGMTPVTTGFIFDHADIARLHYQHDGSENFSDSFAFTVIDNNTYNNPGFDAPGTRSGTMNIGVIPVNDAPAVNVNTGLVSDGNGDRRVYEGGVRVLTTDVLSSVDPDSTTEQVQYRITSAPQNGTLLLNGVPMAAGTAFTQADLASGKLSYRHNGGETSTDLFRFRIDDGASNVAETTFHIGIIAVNDAPVISAPSNVTVNTADFQFSGGRTISITDSDSSSGDITVTLTVSDPGGKLRVTSSNGLTSVSGSETTQLILVGKVADINSALATLRYQATDLDAAATLTIHVNDGGNSGVDPATVPSGEVPGLVNTGTNTDEQATRVVNLLVSPIDDAPVNTVPASVQTAYEDVTFTFNTANSNRITIEDVDAFGGQMEVTLSVLNGRLTLGSTTGLSFSAGSGTNNTTMTFRGTVAAVNAALDGLRYVGNANFEGLDTLTVTTSDLGNTGDGGPIVDTDTVSINVLGVNDRPVISGPSATVLVSAETFVFNAGNAISISDSDAGSSPVTVTVTVGDPGGILALSQTAGLTSISGNGTSNVLTFTGAVTDVNAALLTLAYSPADINGTTTLQVLVNDNGNNGVDPSSIGLPHSGSTTDEQATRTFTLLVSDVNDAPVNSLPTAQTVNEDSTLTFRNSNGNAISISDADAFSGVLTTTITVTNGTLTAGGTLTERQALSSLTGNGSGTLILSGTVAQINAVLQGLVYQPAQHFNGAVTLEITTNDNGNTGIGGAKQDVDALSITVSPVNDAPTVTAPASRTVQEDNALVFSTATSTAITVADLDAAEGTGLLTVTLGVTNGTLTLSGTTNLSFSTGTGTADSSMIFTGTAAAINTALNGLTYNPTADFNGSSTLSITVNDNGNHGAGGALSATRNVAITVSAQADIVADTVSTLEDNAVTFDVIAGTNGASADNFEGTPVITRINSTNVTAGSVVTVSNGTVRVDATSGQLTFTPNANYNGNTNFTYRVTSPAGVHETATVTVQVQAVNDAPVITVPAAQTFNEDTDRVFNTTNGNVISIADVDSGSADVEVTVAAAHGLLFAGGNGTQQGALTTLGGNGSKNLVLRGTVAEINAVLLGLRYSPDANYNGTDSISVAVTDLGNTGLGGALTDSKSIDLTINAINDAPVNTVPAAQTILEDQTLVFSTANGRAISVSDVDVAEGSGILTVTVGVTNGTLTLATVHDLSFSSGANGSASMTFTGTAAAINAALDGLTFTPVADYNGSAQLSLQTSDGGNHGSGGTLTDSDVVNITISPVADVVDDVLDTDEDVDITFNVLTGAGDAEADSFENSGRIITSHTQPANGTVVMAPDGNVTYTPDENWHGVDTFQYTVTSGGVTETATVQITVRSVNDAPVAVNDPFTVAEDGSVTIDVLGNDSDVESDPITITHVDDIAIQEGETVTVTNGTVKLEGGKLIFTPTPDYHGPASFEYTISDGELSSTAIVSGTVTKTPRTLTIADVSADENNNLVFTVTLNKATPSPFTVKVSTVAGTATGGGVDYTTLAGHTLSFAGTKGETVTFTVVVNPDTLIENDEFLTVEMSDVSIADVNIADTATGTILDNDARPVPGAPGEGVTTDVELVLNASGGYDLIIEDVETNSPIGFLSDVPVSDSNDNLLIYRDGANYVIRDLNGLWLGSPVIGATRGALNEIRVPVAMVTGNIIVRTGTGNDVVTIRNLGANLAGNLIVDLEDASGRYTDTDTLNYDSSTTLAAGARAEFRAETINALANASLTTTGGGGIILDAGRNIFLDQNARLASADGDISLEANLDGVVGGRYQAIVMNKASITSGTGDVRLQGRGGTLEDRNFGIHLRNGSSIQTGGGIEVTGTGGGDGNSAHQIGVLITSSQLNSTGSQGVTVRGIGGNGTQSAVGVTIEKGSAVHAGTGDLVIEGTAGSNGVNNYGIAIGGSTLETNGGDIALTGTGAGSAVGIGTSLDGATVRTTGIGTITLLGTGAAGSTRNDGVRLQGKSNLTAQHGDILIEGTSNGTGATNAGVNILGESTVTTASGNGNITVRGSGGFGMGGQGVVVNSGRLTVGEGDLTVRGTGRGTAHSHGVNLTRATLQSQGSGNIDILGQGSTNGTGGQNVGLLGTGSSILSSGTGTIVMRGDGGNGFSLNDGVRLSATQVRAATSILITGFAGSTNGSSAGVALRTGTVVAATGSGTVQISGTGSSSGAAMGRYHRGLEISGSQVTTQNGSVSLNGTAGGANNGSINHGITIANSTVRSTGSGNVTAVGTGRRLGHGINVSNSTVMSASGNINFNGTGGLGNKNARGLSIVRSTLRSTGGGDVTARGTANPNTTGTGNIGAYIDLSTLGTTGDLRVIGTGGGGSGRNHGVFMNRITRIGSTIMVTATKTDGHAKTLRMAGNYFA